MPIRKPLIASAALSLSLAVSAVSPAQPYVPDGGLEPVDATVELNYYIDEPTARVMFDLEPDAFEEGMKARVTVQQPGGKPLTGEGEVKGAGLTVVELPLDGVEPGTYDATLKLMKGDAEAWSGESDLTVKAKPEGDVRVTQTDRYRRVMLVDGKPLFPMGVFGVFPEYLQATADAGFNMTLRWKGATTMHRYDRGQPWDGEYNTKVVNDYLDAIHDAGMYAVETPVKLSEEALYHRYRDIPEMYPKGPYWEDKYPVINEEITPGVVKQARDHPAVIGYYSYDEPDNFYPDTPEHKYHLLMQEGVEEWTRTVEELDPYHAVMTLFATGLSKVEDWDAWDVAMRDFYVNTEEPMAKVYDVAIDSVRTAWGLKTPFIYTPLFEKSSGRPKPLSGPEQRAQTYMSLAADVKGLFYWDWPAAYGPNWEMLSQLAGEVKELEPVLLERAPRQTVEYTDSKTEGSVKALVKNHQGKTYLITVNGEPAPVTVTYSLPDVYTGQADVMFEDRLVTVGGGKLTDELEPYGRHVYVLDKLWPSGETLTVDAAVGEEVEHPDPEFKPSKRNLVANSSFEEDYGTLPGWPYEWHISDTIMESGVVTDDGRWTPVTDEAHHGKRSMRLIKVAPGIGDSDDAFNLATTPAASASLRYMGGGKHVLSAWMKADKPVRTWMMAGWSTYIPVEVGTEWKRYHITYDAKPGHSFVRIYLMQQGTLWIDAVQVEKADEPSEYTYIEPK